MSSEFRRKLEAQFSDEDVSAFRASIQFDDNWYAKEYPDVVASGIDPLRHYMWIGQRLGRFPTRADFERANGIALRWCIIATPHVLFIAHTLAEALKKYNWSVEILLSPPEQFTHDYYIVLCAQMFERLPPGEKRIIYQLEQSASSRWFSDTYISAMENSLAVFDYSLENIEFLETKGLAFPQIYYVPIGASKTYAAENSKEKDIDVLFYGDYKSSERRRVLLDKASASFNVTRADSLFGEDIKSLIARSKLVLNLHYYEDAQLETPRIQECISLGVPVVSESTSDQSDYAELTGAVTFFEAGNGGAMLDAIAGVLQNFQGAADCAIEATSASFNRHSFMLDRFLIGAGILRANALDDMGQEPVSEGSAYALSLPETIKRRRVFDTETRSSDCQVFDGIRRRPGWIGCGMSYKHLCRSALKAGVTQITIMEDDVLLSPDHDNKMEIILQYLEEHRGQWDVFSGVIAHLHDNAKVLGVERYRSLDFITIDKMTSMVFNIYSERAIKLISLWDPSNEDAETNTIDRYLENSDLRIVVTDPYIVGHREELHSTLWGFQNTQYVDMIAESERKLNALKLQWIQSHEAPAR
ncbi:MAG: hypothetical protein RLZZ561_1557 [Pseudomonadota bacterium]|jgi:hypothetical protein